MIGHFCRNNAFYFELRVCIIGMGLKGFFTWLGNFVLSTAYSCLLCFVVVVVEELVFRMFYKGQLGSEMSVSEIIFRFVILPQFFASQIQFRIVECGQFSNFPVSETIHCIAC